MLNLIIILLLQRLGTLLRLSDVDPQTVFLGGLEHNGNDGKFAYNWQDDVTQVTIQCIKVLYVIYRVAEK